VQERLKGTTWTSGCTSWYQQETGKNFALWPGSTWRYWLQTRKVRTQDYVFARVQARQPVKAA